MTNGWWLLVSIDDGYTSDYCLVNGSIDCYWLMKIVDNGFIIYGWLYAT